MANLSDQSGQVSASCFDETAGAACEALAREGRCALVGVELDRRAGEDSARFAIRSARALFSRRIVRRLAEANVTLPEPLPFAGVELERQGSTRYISNRINVRDVG